MPVIGPTSTRPRSRTRIPSSTLATRFSPLGMEPPRAELQSNGRCRPDVQAISAERERSLRVITYSHSTNPVTRTSPARSRYKAPRKAPAGTSSQASDHEAESRQRPHRPEEVAEEAGRGQPDAHRRGTHHDTDLERLTLENEGRCENEHERHDVRRPRQADPGQGSLERTRSREIGGSVGGQRDRRGNHRHEPEIEHEQVRGQGVHAHLDQRRGDQGREEFEDTAREPDYAARV